MNHNEPLEVKVDDLEMHKEMEMSDQSSSILFIYSRAKKTNAK